MKFVRSNKFDLCYYGQVNSLRFKSSVASKWAVNTYGGIIYFACDGTSSEVFLFLMVFPCEEHHFLILCSYKTKFKFKKKLVVTEGKTEPFLIYIR